MLRRLFAGLTGEPRRGSSLFALAVRETRQPGWFAGCGVPDTVDGRFAVLATVAALLIVRLEADGDAGEGASVALTERFVESIDAEVREMGVSDPAIGKQVRSLVGILSARVGLWRATLAGADDWDETVVASLHAGRQPSPDVVRAGEAALRDLWQRFSRASLDDLARGEA